MSDPPREVYARSSESRVRRGEGAPTLYTLLDRIVALEQRMQRREDIAQASLGEHGPIRRDVDHLEALVTDPERGLFSQMASLRSEVHAFRREVVVAVTIIVILANFVVPYVIAALGGPE